MRVAIVNDLVLARRVLRRVVEGVPGCRVAWEAADGGEAVRRAAADPPDAILMDLVMPGLDGAGATRQIMAASPCPILVVTASLGGNHGLVYDALGAGGLDAVETPTLGPGGELAGAGPIASRLAKLAARAKPGAERPWVLAGALDAPPLIAIGASTGGPEAVAQVLAGLGATPAAVVVIQHIAADYTHGLAHWLTRRCGLPAGVPADGEAPAAGRVAVAGGEDHLALDGRGLFRYTPEPLDYPYRPSVDVFFESAARHWPGPGVGILLTGMGGDGARGLGELRRRGWPTIAQDQESCVVWGMPKLAAELGAAREVLPLSAIGPRARTWVTAAGR